MQIRRTAIARSASSAIVDCGPIRSNRERGAQSTDGGDGAARRDGGTGRSIGLGVTTRDDHQYFAAYGAVGVAVRVGPGRFFVELGARVASDAHGRTGFASPAGWSLIAGYRLGLR